VGPHIDHRVHRVERAAGCFIADLLEDCVRPSSFKARAKVKTLEMDWIEKEYWISPFE
jgi:hypothetical protein